MWTWFLQVISHPATEAGIHLMVLAIFFMEVWQHYSHHKKNKAKRGEPLYTLDEAKAKLFETVALADPAVFALPGPIKVPQDIDEESLAKLEKIFDVN